ncbi:MAG TPA: outer membrane lipoprotein carrier protein LolA [Gemmatimonadaceae bacterium]|nr:outer membrane lipoprotein carrier protein LolA [Gemmatimonadaceae bacterium]
MRIIATIIAVGAAVSVQAQTPDAIMQRASSAYSDMKTVRAEFQQTITNPLTGTNSVSSGVMFRKAPNLLSVTFTSPKGDRVVADGKSLWVYLPSSAPGQVIRMPANGKNTLALVEPGELFLSSPSSRYDITSGGSATLAGRKTNIISLVPKKPNNMFTRAKLWVDTRDNSIRQFEVVDANGLTRVVTITKLQSNLGVAASEFKFSPPKNARILDSTAFPGN